MDFKQPLEASRLSKHAFLYLRQPLLAMCFKTQGDQRFGNRGTDQCPTIGPGDAHPIRL